MIPSREESWVLVIKRSPAEEIPSVKVRAWRAGRAWKLTEPTLVKDGKERVDKMVRPSRKNFPPISVKEFPEKLVRLTAPSTLKSPSILSIPSRLMLSAAEEAIATDPEMVPQLAS